MQRYPLWRHDKQLGYTNHVRERQEMTSSLESYILNLFKKNDLCIKAVMKTAIDVWHLGL